MMPPLVDQGLARWIIPEDGILFTSVCQVKAFVMPGAKVSQ
jgi:hypothetical protein